ncbi:Ppx/GppA phosphatase family protein [Microvirga subterranea]|uniref:Exopolyphosphatase/guanosine-5'-triphosphate, 3'-diphosphate pyrophosphatase n=1 Tax=Microvirga subterranea TaxID=186651 RepID=A0A370HPK4_9HYPH|nr:exopolyphosphatase/guanosine-5'-triphosphate,3'-diphosphate pyrophosphatase [Microvirga subterranea]
MTVKYDATAESGERRADPLSGSSAGASLLVDRAKSAVNKHHRHRSSRHYAALDLGTNNCRLLIAEPAHFGFRVVDAFSRIVRLGEGLGLGNLLSEDAIERTIDALRVCRDKMAAKDVARARLVATEACRLAENGRAFIERVRHDLDMDLEVVDRRTEAFLAVTGCAALADPKAESVIIFDIGGGSTEIAWLDGAAPHAFADPCKRIRAWDSLPVGVVTLAERHGGIEVTREKFENMVEEVTELLLDFALIAAKAGMATNFHLLGTSGTVTTVGGIHLGLARYDRRRVDGMWMRSGDISTVIDRLLYSDFEQRAANPCIGRDRADLVLAGCAILEAIRRAFPSDRLRIADRGLREGILMNMMREDSVWRQGGAR